MWASSRHDVRAIFVDLSERGPDGRGERFGHQEFSNVDVWFEVQYSNQVIDAAFFSAVYGGKRCSMATSGGEMNIDLAWVSVSKPYFP
jgi:hypothetical protein